MTFAQLRRLVILLLAALCLPAIAAPRHAPRSIPAAFLSDIHLDPLRDPTIARLLNAAPLSQWGGILAQPDSSTQAADYAVINKVCLINPLTDTTNTLWQSTLAELHTQAPHIRFLTLSGDLVGHQFDCRYKQIFPNATHDDLTVFVEKTVRYVVSGLRTALPGVPLYIALGNNDNACHDNQLDPDDPFLALVAGTIAEALPRPGRPAIVRDFPHGYYSAALPSPMSRTRILVVNDVYAMASYKDCSARPDPQAQTPVLDWLESQLRLARTHHRHVIVMSHVPPGVNPYSTYNRHSDICLPGGSPVLFLATDRLAQILTAYSDVVSLALFGHSHTDEMRLLRPDPGSHLPGVAVKILPSISPVFAELPSFTLGKISPRTGTLLDYTVVMASNSTGIDAIWAPTYTYSTTYRQPAFNPAALNQIIATFQSDPTIQTPTSQAYLREYRHSFFDDHSTPLRSIWPQFVCATDHITATSFTSCACPTPHDSPSAAP